MSDGKVHAVWYKRDLRIRDHAPLCAAAIAGDVLPIYIVEPAILGAEDMDAMHYAFIRECLSALRQDLMALGVPLVVRVGDAVDVFKALHAQVCIAAIHAHEETGNALTFARDRRVMDWAAELAIPLLELPQTGVVRRLASRNGWSKIWTRRMQSEPLDMPEEIEGVTIDPGEIPNVEDLRLTSLHPAVDRRQQAQRGGEAAAEDTLESFLTHRGQRYQREISAPEIARRSCSRLSPYLAYGAISMRQVVADTTRSGLAKRAASAFLSRLHWHCHFMQKLESQPTIEFQSFNPLYENLRLGHDNETYLTAWCHGKTGFPFVDACMRSLQTTGWLNFRMRAMLVSFAAYDLWLDWRCFRDFLARQFIDYEPGIHFSQLQMQSGVTGINTPRMYNPIKQGYDHDPDGHFVRRWVPELARVPALFIHEPWKMTALEIADCGFRPGIDYPDPVVDHTEAIRYARAEIARVRNNQSHREIAGQVFERHGSRKGRGDRQTNEQYRQRRKRGQDGRRFNKPDPADNQLSLFE